MLKGLRDQMRRHFNKEAAICLKQMKPEGFENSITNLGKNHQLKLWYLQNSPKNKLKNQYLHEVEVLHDEINYKSIPMMGWRMLLLGALCFGYVYVWNDKDEDTYDFGPRINYKHDKHAMIGLQDGGYEVIS